ncbi:MAG: hypothetical protein V1794_14555 [Candidatus Glassbacteria bacterium]
MKKNELITVPFLKDGAWKSEERSFAKVLECFKKDIDLLPRQVKEMKKADNEKWGTLFEELAKYAESNPEFAKVVRVVEKKGQRGLSVGEPNWFWIPIFLSFVAGYALGSCAQSCGSKK